MQIHLRYVRYSKRTANHDLRSSSIATKPNQPSLVRMKIGSSLKGFGSPIWF